MLFITERPNLTEKPIMNYKKWCHKFEYTPTGEKLYRYSSPKYLYIFLKCTSIQCFAVWKLKKKKKMFYIYAVLLLLYETLNILASVFEED